MLLRDRGNLDGAEPLLREALAGTRRILGDTDLGTLISVCNLGKLLQDRSDLGSAELLFREALAASRRTLGDNERNHAKHHLHSRPSAA